MMPLRHPADDALLALARGTAAGVPTDAATHVEACARCRDLVAGFATVDAHVAHAPREIGPPIDLWPSLRARLDVAASTPAIASASLVRRPLWARHAAVAAALCVAAAGTLLGVRRFTHDPQPPVAAAPLPSDAHADAVEAQLLSDLELQRGRLRPTTAAQVDESLHTLDSAITEIQRALRQEPGSQLLRDLLAASRERKADLLRQTENAS